VKEDVTGLDDSNPYYEKWWFGVEPMSGVTMAKVSLPQICFEVSPPLREFFNISSATVPAVWLDDYGYIGADDAELFRTVVYGLQTAALVLFVAGVALGVILTCIGIVIVHSIKKEFGFHTEMKEF